MDEKLTILEAYCAMRLFLDNYYNLTRSDDIGALLSDLILLNDAEKKCRSSSMERLDGGRK